MELLMNCRSRFLKTIHLEEPDRVPTFTTLTPQVAEKIGKELGLPFEPEDSPVSTRISHTEILLQLGNDAVGVGPLREKGRETKKLPDGTSIDEFGIIYQQVGWYDEAIRRPLEQAQSPRDVLNYDLPKALDPARWTLAEKVIAKYKSEYAIIGDLESTFFELSWNLIGLEKFLIDLALEEGYLFTLFDRIIEEYAIPCGKKMIEMGIDLLWAGDDFGTQKGMLISPEFWRKHFKKRYAYIFSQWKKENPDLKLAYHSCGSIVPIIPDLIEIGLDILNPIQPQAAGMDLGKLKKQYGDKLVFFGGVDEQKVLPFGSKGEVREEVKKKICQGGRGGGYIIAPAHNIQPDTPLENVYAYFEAIREFGQYPLNC